MKQIAMAWVLVGLGFALAAVEPAEAQDMQQKIEAAKQSAAQNQQALRSYSWIEKTEVSVKGEVKSTQIESCKYGPDGKVQKTSLSEPAAQEEPEQPHGPKARMKARVKSKVVEKKKAEMTEEMKAAAALVHQYLPPDPAKIQAAKAAGKITVTPGAGTNAVHIADYEKAGDSLILTLDASGKGMQKIDVSSYLEEPDDKVTLDVQMASLPDGTSYAGQILLSVPGDHIDVKITNSNYQKITP